MSTKIPESARAVVITSTCTAAELKTSLIPVKLPTTSNQILVRNEFIGVNYIDTYHRSGLYKVDFPFILGREAAGKVVAVHNDNQSEFKVGDRVAMVQPSTYADYTLVDVDSTVKVPDNVALDIAAAVLSQGMTAYVLTTRSFAVKPGKWILIHAGAGGTGQLLVQLCLTFGAQVITTVSTDEKAKAVRQLGVEHVINYSHESVPDRVREITKGYGVDCVYDGVGKDTFDASLECLALCGTMVAFGNASGKVPPVDILRLTPKNLVLLRPTLTSYVSTVKEFKDVGSAVLKLVADGKLKVSIWKTLSLDEAAVAHKSIESRGTIGKILLKT